MTVYFIGAGPGAPDLITVRGQRLIERCPVCLYAGSLVPVEIVAAAPTGALVRDTAPMHLDEIVAEMAEADTRDEDVARVHSGDPSLYGAIAEQMRRLHALGIAYEVVPGVPAFAGAAARLATELTLPEISQTVILTRTSGKASPMPERESLEVLGQSGATLAIHLSVRNLAYVEQALTQHYGSRLPSSGDLPRHLAGRGNHRHHAFGDARKGARERSRVPRWCSWGGSSARRSFATARCMIQALPMCCAMLGKRRRGWRIEDRANARTGHSAAGVEPDGQFSPAAAPRWSLRRLRLPRRARRRGGRS